MQFILLLNVQESTDYGGYLYSLERRVEVDTFYWVMGMKFNHYIDIITGLHYARRL